MTFESELPGEIICDANTSILYSNASSNQGLAELQVLIPGTLVFFLVLPFVLFHFRFFPISTTPAVVMGALLMVVTNVVSQEEAYAVMGHRDNLTAIFLLLGMMLLAQYVEREQILVKILKKFLLQHYSFANYVWRICAMSFVLSALFTNDACCAIFTPLALKFWETQERPRSELETILLAIATSANIGSVTTTFGNPQMALIAAKTSGPEFAESRLDMLACVIYLLPAAVVVQLLNTCFLIAHYKFRTRHIERAKLVSEASASASEQEMAGLRSSNGLSNAAHAANNETILFISQDRLSMPTSLETIKEDEVLEIPENRIDIEAQERELVLNSNSDSDSDESEPKSTAEDLTQVSAINYKPSQLTQLNDEEHQHHNERVSEASLNRIMDGSGLQLSHRAGIYKSVGAMSASDFLPVETGLKQMSSTGSLESLFSAGDSVFFPIVLLVLMITVLTLFFATAISDVEFDTGLVPMGAAASALVADAILNKRSGLYVIKRVDWSIILMFLGLFVWVHGFNNTGLPHWVWSNLGLEDAEHLSVKEIAILTVFVVIGSNLFSNVPLVLILLQQFTPCAHQKPLALYLAWVSTIAGNLTLFGSVANLIVVQKGVQALKYRLSFWQYFVFGFPTTLLHVVVGIVIITAFLLIPI